jgi:hypothetical protein
MPTEFKKTSQLPPALPQQPHKPGEPSRLLNDRTPAWETPAVAAIALCLITACWFVPRPTGDLYVAFAGARDLMDGKLGQPGGVGVPGQSGAKNRPAAPLVKALGWFGVHTGGADDWCWDQPRPVWMDQNWGTQLLFDAAYKTFGKNGVPGLKGVLMLAMAVSILLASRQHGVRWPVAILLAGCAVAGGHGYIDLRPNIILLTLAPMMYWLLVRSRHNPHRIWWAVFLMLLWGNMHGSFIFGLAMMALWTVCGGLPAAVRDEPSRQRRLLWMGAIGLICLAPFGIVVGAVYFKIDIGRIMGEPWYWLPALAPLAAIFLLRKAPPAVRAGLRRQWPVLLAPVFGLFLTTVVTLFGLENLAHPFIMGASKEWRNVAEWYPVLPTVKQTYGTTAEFFIAAGLLALLATVRPLVRVVFERKRANASDWALIVFAFVAGTYTVFSAIKVVTDETLNRSITQVAGMLARLRRTASPQEIQNGEAYLAEVREPLDDAIVPLAVFAVIAIGSLMTFILVMSRRHESHERDSRGQASAAGETSLFLFAIILVTVALCMAFMSRRFVTLSLGLVAPLLATLLDWAFREAGRLQFFRYARPAVLAGLAAFIPAGLYVHRILPMYYPGNPSFQPQLSTLFDRMTMSELYIHGGAEFLNLNHVSGNAVEDWRWEGFLHWRCPQMKIGVGGRAQQAHDTMPYLRNGRLWGTPSVPSGSPQEAAIRDTLQSELQSLGVQYIIGDGSAERFVRPLTSAGSRWAIVYFDTCSYNVILADTSNPGARQLIDKIISGDALWPSWPKGAAAASRAMCMSAPVLGIPASRRVEAMKEACRQMPSATFYNRLAEMQRKGEISLEDYTAFLASQYEELGRPADSPYANARNLEARGQVAFMLAELARVRGDQSGEGDWLLKFNAIKQDLGKLLGPWARGR